MLAKYSLHDVVKFTFCNMTEVLSQLDSTHPWANTPYVFRALFEMTTKITEESMKLAMEQKFTQLYMECFLYPNGMGAQPVFPIPLEKMTPVTTITLREIAQHCYVIGGSMLESIDNEEQARKTVPVLIDAIVASIQDAEKAIYSDDFIRIFGNPLAYLN